MCGLIGALSRRNVAPLLLDGLKRLEYRGYDSAGLACIDGAGISVHRRVGKVAELERLLQRRMPDSAIGIGHTRWATHGEPEERNAHPQVSRDTIAVVHNGIIENYEGLRKMLEVMGYAFSSDTDTEVVAHLVHYHYAGLSDLFAAVRTAVNQLVGAYAIAVMAADRPDCLVVARQGNPLAVGIGDGEQFVASDAVALLPFTDRFVFLEDGDVACLAADGLSVLDADGQAVERPLQQLDVAGAGADKGPYRHYMLKEIHEQPDALADTIRGCVEHGMLLPAALGFTDRELLQRVQAVHIVACGTSHHAGEVARYWLESVARLPCSVDLASEYRYRDPVVPPGCLFVTLSQSGETADTLAALRYAAKAGYLGTLAICNCPASSLVRESAMHLLTRAGPEIGVASTKAFTTQLLSVLLLTLLLAHRHRHDAQAGRSQLEQLRQVSARVEDVLNLSRRIEALAVPLVNHASALFLGRGPLYPIAREGALKLKEISYIHAEAYASGELKHGPLALVDDQMPVIALAPSNLLLDKQRSNLREVQARKGQLFVFSDRDSGIEAGPGVRLVEMPKVDALSAPIVYAVALQLLAYHAAVLRGSDVDKPRNLAKSVTVE
ncbi:MAG: glutamine--fructose-6-phosphate transaminase (isomerizing) [Nevskia sp.]|nr:glutamine--fructose-6-phosphate transaminase (isomerizing) [Nevskia sp.]